MEKQIKEKAEREHWPVLTFEYQKNFTAAYLIIASSKLLFQIMRVQLLRNPTSMIKVLTLYETAQRGKRLLITEYD